MVIFLVILAITVFAAQKYFLKHSLDRVYYDCEPSQNLIDPNEPFTIVSTIENQKKLIVFFVKMIEDFPLDIILEADENNIYKGIKNVQLTSRFYLRSMQVYRREVTAKLPKRGCHYFSGCTMYGGDFLGTRENMQYYRGIKEVVVMPKPLDSVVLDKTLGDYLGDLSVNRFILEDPVLTTGFSEYTGREPMRSISWVQSARFGKMMVKNYDHTLDLSVTILLNVKVPVVTFENEEKIEKCFQIVRSVCEALEKKKVKYKFATNATISGFAGSWSEINEGLGGNHFMTVMEGLGRATCFATEPFSSLIERESHKAESGRSFILVTPDTDDESWLPNLKFLEEISNNSVSIFTPDMFDDEETEAENI